MNLIIWGDLVHGAILKAEFQFIIHYIHIFLNGREKDVLI